MIHLDPESCASKGDRTTVTSSFHHTSNRLRFCGYGQLQRPQFNHTGLPCVPICSHPPRFRKSTVTLSCQWRRSNCGTPLAVFTCTFVERNQHLLFRITVLSTSQSPLLAGNSSLPLSMSGRSLGGVSLTGGQYGYVNICALL